jgi:cytochrome c-type biogenesis protein CcmE
MKNGRFLVGLVGVAAMVAWLMWTGISDSMVYYLTPGELLERVESEPTFHEIGVKVGGRVVEGSWARRQSGAGTHEFLVSDLEDPEVTFAVRYGDILPDTFNDEAEVVVEGIYGADGIFRAHTVLTKCGSRFEAAEEELAA